MTLTRLLAAALLAAGGVVILLACRSRRMNLRTRMRVLDGVPLPSHRQRRRAVIAGAALLAVPAVPVGLVVGRAPAFVVAVGVVATLPTLATIAVELQAGLRRGGMPRRIPLTAAWQQRLVGELVARLIAPFPAPPLRRRRPRVRSTPSRAAGAGAGRRLLVVPAGLGPLRPWEIAEIYLASRSRYRDLLALNRGRRSPSGELISEDSRIGAGWTLLMPRDAIGAGLVDLPGDLRRALPGAAVAQPPVHADPEAVTEEADVAPDENLDDAPAAPPEQPLGHPPADLPWDLVHAQLLADGVSTAARIRRHQRDHDRPFGADVRPLDGSAAAVHMAAEIGADRRGAALIDLSARQIAPGSRVLLARLVGDRVDFFAAEGRDGPPVPIGSATNGNPDAALPPSGPSRLPGLVSLGRDRDGWVLADLLAATGPVALAGDPRACRMVATAIGLELVVKRWSDDLRVMMIGFGLALDGLDPRLRCANHLGDVVDEVIRRDALNQDAMASGAEESVLPQFVVLAEPPSSSDYALLRKLSEQQPAALGALVVGGGSDDHWTFALDGDGVLRCGELGVTVGAQAVSVETAESLVRLVRAEEGSPAPDGVGPVEAPPLPRDSDPVASELTIRLFGRPRLEGPAGLIEADPTTVEIIALLALQGRASPEAVAAAVYPFGIPEADLRAALELVVEALESSPSGRPGLLVYDDGELELTPDVHADWHQFVALCRAGRELDALELLSAGPAAERPGMHEGARYGWLPSVPLARALPGFIADTAHGVARRRMGEDRPDLAAVAASSGLRAQPFSQLLRDDLESSVRAMSPKQLTGSA
jgi:hypothetical protein